jgi:putative effector of murein hydrolase LrgA (UPF0299 family)
MLITEALRVLACLCAGEILSGMQVLPLPGPVISLVFLLANLALIGDVPQPLGRLADNVLAVLGMLFVPTGVGLLACTHLLRTEFAPIAAAAVIWRNSVEWRAGEAGTPPRRPTHKEPMIKAKAVRLAAGLALALGGAAAPAGAQFMYPVIIVPPPPAQNLVLPPKPKPSAPKPDASVQSPDTPNTPAPVQCYYQGKTRVCP